MSSSSFTSITTRAVRLGIAAAAVAAAAVPTGLAFAHSDGDHSADQLTRAQREVVREATEQFRDVEVALAAGYLPTDSCAALPGTGGMGYHFINPTLAADGRIDPTRPEVLVYSKRADGQLRLGAIEYFAADSDQDLATDADRPTLMGHAFDGPMPGHEPGMPIHYDLHVWLYKSNPAGMLAPWNPTVTCP